MHIALRNVSPTIPTGEVEREMLRSDLYGIGCGVTGAALELEERGFHSPICPDPGTKDGAE